MKREVTSCLTLLSERLIVSLRIPLAFHTIAFAIYQIHERQCLVDQPQQALHHATIKVGRSILNVFHSVAVAANPSLKFAAQLLLFFDLV